MIRRHPSSNTLLRLAAGSLPGPHTRVVQVHLAACAHCREQVERYEAVGGALLADMAPVAPAADMLDRVLARLDEQVVETQPEPPDLSVAGVATGHWRRLAPGIRIMRLARRDPTGTRLDLLCVAPGVALPLHTHSGFETTCIMQGSYEDETGEYGLHDFAEGEPGRLHRPVAGPGQDCICILATTGALRPDSWMARMFMRLVDL